MEEGGWGSSGGSTVLYWVNVWQHALQQLLPPCRPQAVLEGKWGWMSPSIPHGINQLYKGCTIWHDDPEKCMVTSMKITYTEIEVMDWGPAEHHHWHPAIYTGQQLSSTKKQKSTTKNKNKNKKRRRKQKQQQQKTKKPVTQMLQSKEWGNRIPWCKVRWNLRTQDKRSITVPSSGHQICTSLLQQ